MNNSAESDFKCPLCDERFSDNDVFAKHFKVNHPSTKPSPKFRCDNCFQTFTRKSDVTKHINKRRCKELYGRGKKKKTPF